MQLLSTLEDDMLRLSESNYLTLDILSEHKDILTLPHKHYYNSSLVVLVPQEISFIDPRTIYSSPRSQSIVSRFHFFNCLFALENGL